MLYIDLYYQQVLPLMECGWVYNWADAIRDAVCNDILYDICALRSRLVSELDGWLVYR